MAHPITFIVPGQEQTSRGTSRPAIPAGLGQGRIKHSVQVGAARGSRGEVRVTAVPEEDVVVLHIADGPMLVLHPENARDLFLAQSTAKKRDAAAAPDDIVVPAHLGWRGLEENVITPNTRGTRGFLGGVVLNAVDIITGLKKDAADFMASEVVRKVDAQVDPGVYALTAASLPALKGSGRIRRQIDASPDDGPLLVLIHGTFSETSGTFGKLWTQHPQLVQRMFRHYKDRVYALDHPTLGASPIENALTLAAAMPAGVRLHLLTHSRGGLVAEVLARVCNDRDLTDADFSYFAGPHYSGQLADLRKLAALVKQKSLRVERVVRVACPARGTLLASRRLDAFVSVFNWTLGAAGIPVVPELVGFLGEVARRRASPEQVPGLAAQIPDSPLVQWLHQGGNTTPGQLRVVAGDIRGDSVSSWIKTLLADAYYWTDNDLVVQTRSMYGGAPRTNGASFLFDQGGQVSHFRYFSNESTARAIVGALTEDAPQGFRTIGPLSWAGESSTGLRSARLRLGDGRSAGDKPAVFILPGILGSNLKRDGKRIWLGWRIVNGLKLLSYNPDRSDGIEPDGAIESTYDELEVFLGRSHEVVEFAYDWRCPIEEEAGRLAIALEAAMNERERSGQPVRILAHSMGGLVARAAELVRPDIWARMMAHPGARFVMLGTPNGGSWAPMQVLSGDDTFGNTLIALGAPFQDHKARSMMANFPGFIQLQAGLLDGAFGLDQEAMWKKLADDDLRRVREYNWWHNDSRQLNAYMWGVPSQKVLDQAVSLRRRLDTQRDKHLAAFRDQTVLVTGQARFTPDGYDIGNEGLAYLNAEQGGDGRVTVESAVLPGVRTWMTDCEHGKLPDHRSAFEAYLELLERGDTARLEPLAGASVRGMATASPLPARVRSRPAHARRFLPPESMRDLQALPETDIAIGSTPELIPLRITVVNGNLKFIRQPLMLGHYRASVLTGTELVMNGLMGGDLSKYLSMGQYPDLPGSHKVFFNTTASHVNPLQLPRPEAVIVVGLGEESKLRPADLVKSITQGAIAWSQRIAEANPVTPVRFDLAATLVGSGGTGISAGQAARLIAVGIREANELLTRTQSPSVGHLQLVELYLDRATDAYRALQVLNTANPGQYAITEVIQTGTGPLRRPLDASYRGTGYDLITAQSDPRGDSLISYTLDTRRARTEVRAQATQSALLRSLIDQASVDQNGEHRIGQTLFQLLIPIEMRPFLSGTTEMLMELDTGTAVIPWEMLDTRSDKQGADLPWAIRAKLLRRLRTESFRSQVTEAERSSRILVIGEPKCDDRYPRLPGAHAEAKAVAARLTMPGGLSKDMVTELFSKDAQGNGPNALEVITTVFSRGWRIVHIAGHGMPPEEVGGPLQKRLDPRGVVLSDDTFLGPREIENMPEVPELVFVNCCHLAARPVDQLLHPEIPLQYNRPRFAANVAESLIRIGVRCVIAAGWAVDDNAAAIFATTFYGALLSGARFIDAVGQAREAAWKAGGNTWAAYQCYGDPEWIFRPDPAGPHRMTAQAKDESATISSPSSLVLALETLAVSAKFDTVDREEQRTRIRHLEEQSAPHWSGIGAVAEAFGVALAAIGEEESAIAWYQAALAASDGSASIKAVEQVASLQIRLAWRSVENAMYAETDGSAKTVSSMNGQKSPISEAVLVNAKNQLQGALDILEQLVKLHPTLERESLCGSVWKRRAAIEALAGNTGAEMKAFAHMKEHYLAAEMLARQTANPDLFYPALNRIAAELIIDAARPGWNGIHAETLAAVQQSLNQKAHNDPDFWSVVGLIELRLYESIARGELSTELPSLIKDFEDLHRRVPSVDNWRTVRQQAYLVLTIYMERARAGEKPAISDLLMRMDAWAALKRPVGANGEPTPRSASPKKPVRVKRARASRPREVAPAQGTNVGSRSH